MKLYPIPVRPRPTTRGRFCPRSFQPGLLFAAMVFLVGPQDACADFTSFGNSGTQAAVTQDINGNDRFQGILPGQILTPALRLDLDATGREGFTKEVQPPEEEEEAKQDAEPKTFIFPNDIATELVSLRLRFTNTRVKDIGAIAIAREGGDTFVSPENPLATSIGPSGGPLVGEADTLGNRLGAARDGLTRMGIYTPDEDPIIAYIPAPMLLKDASHPLNAYDTNWTLTINFLDIEEARNAACNGASLVADCTDIPSFVVGTPDILERYTNGDFRCGNLTPARLNPTLPLGANGNPLYNPRPTIIRAAGPDSVAFGTFYILVAPSRSIESGDIIQVEMDVLGDTEPVASSSLSPEGPLTVDSDQSESENQDSQRFVYYDYGFGGLILRIPDPACEDAGADDTEAVCELPAAYLDTASLPLFPGNMIATLECVQLVADQVPNRKVNDVRIEIEGGVEIPTLFGQSVFRNEIWSQFPPGYPLIQRFVANPDPTDFTVRTGRSHLDASLSTDPYPSPEVLASGAQEYAWFGFDLAGGWHGGYDFRFSNLVVEVQGLGELNEIPRDGMDNDGDGLTDEPGTEDTPFDRQLPGRNDDVDFFADLRPVSADALDGMAVNGGSLTADEQFLAAAILANSVQSAYDVGWDPVFSIRHVLDDAAESNFNEPLFTYDLPDKFYRDVMIPGLANRDGLTNRFQPELGIRLNVLRQQNPARSEYIASLLRIGALQSRLIDEDGDGEAMSPEILGFKIADGLDNDGNGLIDEGIDEEVENGIDDDGDGRIDEDVNFVPALLNIDEEIHNFFVDNFGGRAGAYDEGVDFLFIDYNHNGVYDDGRNDQLPPNRDEFQGTAGTSPLVEGDPYTPPIAYPIDDDLDAESEDGNPLTAPPVIVDASDNNGDGYVDNGANEDVRDLVFSDFGDYTENFFFAPVNESWLYQDTGDSRFIAAGRLPGLDDPIVQPFTQDDIPFHIPAVRLNDPDRYLLGYNFADGDSPGPSIDITNEGQYDFFLGFRIPENRPIGEDFQVTLYPGGLGVEFDTRSNFNPGFLSYPITGDDLLQCRFPGLSGLPGQGSGESFVPPLTSPARPTGYQITKRQFAHLQVADAFGYQSPVEVDGGYRGLPYLDNLSAPMPVIAINHVGAREGSGVSEENATLNSVRVNFDPIRLPEVDSVWNPTTSGGDLRPLSNSSDSGVALYLDSKTSGAQGEFDQSDAIVPLNLETLSWNQDPTDPVVRAGGYYVVLKPAQGIRLPKSDFTEIPSSDNIATLDPNRGYDLFVCVKTNTYTKARTAFRAFIRPGDITYVNGRNTIGSGVVTHPYVSNVPILLNADAGANRPVIPLSDSIPVLGMNMLDVNTTFGSRPAGWSMLNVLFQNNPVGDLAFTPSDLLPMRSDILRNIPLDPAEDNDNNPNTFPLPDGIDNDDDGLTDEGVNNTLDFDLSRYTTLSGVAIFRDMPNSDRNGLFDDPLDPNVRVPDLPVFLSGEENFAFPIGTEAYISLALDHDPVDINAPGKGDPIDPAPFETVPTNDNGANRGSDYFLVIRTSKSISQGDDFQVRLTTHGTVIHTNDGGAVGIVVGTSFGFMPGATTGLGPIFPERQPYSYDPLRNARLVPSLAPVAEEPLSPGNLRIPGISAFDTDPPDPRLRFLGIDFTRELFPIRSPFNLYEAYKPFLSNVYVNTEDGDDLPNLQFLLPTFDETIGTDLDIDPGTVFLRWADIDEDSPDAEVTLVYFPVLIDPMFGELFPLTPTDPRFTFTVIRGVSRGLDPNSDIDDFTIVPYQDQLLITDNENVVGGLGTDIFTWDARLVPPGLYRIAAFLNDFSNPPVVVVGGRILIENQRPELILTQP